MIGYRRIALVIVAGLAILTLGARDARADAPSQQLKGQVDRILKTLQDPALRTEAKSAERRQTIRKIAGEIFDFEETSKRALGTHWRELTPAEQQEFVQLFTDLLESSYISKVDTYQGEKVAYTAETLDGDHAVVKTKIVTPKGSEIPIDYRMASKGGRWLVYDVTIEGVSLVGNYRTQFNKVIQTSSYQALVEKLRAKAFSAPAAAPKT